MLFKEECMEAPQSDVMTIEDVANYLRIPLSSAYKLAQEGKIPGQKVGRHWRFHRTTVEKWISEPESFGTIKLKTGNRNHAK
jgi:excisionase family DNA binding protein